MPTVTRTSVYNVVEFADPYKVCRQCAGWVTGALDAPGPVVVLPCEHDKGYVDLCPSWGPVDGCQCREFLGAVTHPEPPKEGHDG